jgi:undecaprenyl diphosphate synthase
MSVVPPPAVPHHVAIVMDGNGRWAASRGRIRTVGHRVGGAAVRAAIEFARQRDVRVLTLYAFSQENWSRPEAEIQVLMRLFARAFRQEVTALHAQQVRLRFIGARTRLSPALLQAMTSAEALTAANTALDVVVAIDYGGQWDICQAAQRCVAAGADVTPEAVTAHLSTAGLPDVDLLIRTGGERRLSNFLLWQAAYAELYFTDTLWPAFDHAAFDEALQWFFTRQRRFGTVPAVNAPVATARPPRAARG